jgi:hypothetical protein
MFDQFLMLYHSLCDMKHEMVKLSEHDGPSPSSSVDCLVLLFPIVRVAQEWGK